MRRDHRPVPSAALLTESCRIMTLGNRRDVTCVLATSRDHGAQETDPPAVASLAKRRLTWLVHVTAIIASCEPPKVVGKVTSSVTMTGVPEVYGMPKTDRNHVRLPAQELPAYQEDWLEGDADPPAHGPVGPEASLYRWQNSMTDRGSLNTDEATTHVPLSSRNCSTVPQGASRSPEVLVIGLGYVGLPLAAEASRAGLTVTGFDTNRAVSGQTRITG